MATNPYIFILSAAGRHMFTDADWKALLQLARDYGWPPMGTSPPPGRDDLSWDRTYHPPQGQSLSPEDGERFAAALERALADIPALPDQPVTAPPSVSPIGLAALSYYQGPRRALLQRLIASARAGALFLEAQAQPAPIDAKLRERDA